MNYMMTKWDERFLRIVDEVTSWSKDPSTKCGAIIVRPDRSIVSYGYNNFPAKIEDTSKRRYHRPTKYELVVHSETNALLFARENVEGYTMYASTIPCCRCAMNIIQAKIARVICHRPTADYITRWAESIKQTLILFEEGRVMCVWEDN